MKKLIVIIALLLLVSFSVTAYAAGNDWDSLAPYATIDLSVLKEAGWQCTFDEMKFTATMNPADNKIGISVGKDGSTYSIVLQIAMVYVKETSECAFIPRMVFTRLTKTTTRMDTAYIKVGENRYTVNFSDVAGGLYKSPYYVNLASEPFGTDGAAMIYDMAFSGKEVKILMGDSEEAVVSSNQLLKLKSYYETCQKAGVFNTEYFASYSDNYEARIILNK